MAAALLVLGGTIGKQRWSWKYYHKDTVEQNLLIEGMVSI